MHSVLTEVVGPLSSRRLVQHQTVVSHLGSSPRCHPRHPEPWPALDLSISGVTCSGDLLFLHCDRGASMSVSSLQIPDLCPNTAPCACPPLRTPGHCGPRSSSAPRACAAVALPQRSPFSCPGRDSPAGILSQNKCLKKDQIQQPQEPCSEVGWAGMKPSVTRPLGTQSRGQGPVCFLGLTPLLLSRGNLLHWIMWAVPIMQASRRLC